MPFVSCPVCFREIDQKRIILGNAYCSCGHTVHMMMQTETKREVKASLPLILFTTLLVGAIAHAINWDTYFFSIIPLKMKQIVGVAKPKELKSIAEICEIRKKINCEIQALEKAYEMDKSEYPVLLKVGQIYIDQKNYPAASLAYGNYFRSGGTDEGARFGYARALGETGQFRDAKKQFHFILKKNQAKPQFQVARAYVELLMRNKDYATAKSIIEEYRRAGPSATMFLDKEWKQVNDKLKSPTT